MLERISRLIKSKKITASQFADEIGVQRSSVSHVISGRNKPSLDFVTKILLAYPDINSDWLLSGEGNMISDDGTEVDGHDISIDSQTTMDLDSHIDDKQEASAAKKAIEKKKAGSKRITSGHKAIERIVLFYNDGTFIDFTPNK